MFSHPAFSPYRPTLDAAHPLLGDRRWIEQYNAAVAPQVQLIADETERGAMAYEQFIHAHAKIPTRVGALHDLMNAAVWRQFPLTKRLLNTKHLAEGEDLATPNRRSSLRDGLTLFDESGIIIVGESGDLPAAHIAHDWRTLFVAQREAWQQLQVIVFGHGLLESLATRAHPGLVGKTLWLQQSIPAAQIDGFLSEIIKKTGHDFKTHLRPLPLAGVPGWNPRNAHPDFYTDARIFRPVPTIRK
jgi:Protein of unknown function (DUF3025)